MGTITEHLEANGKPRFEPEALERKMKNGRIQFDLPTKGANVIRTSKIPLTHLAKHIQERRAAAIGRMKEYGQD